MSVLIVLFLRTPRPITQHLPLFHGHFYELNRLLHRRTGRVVPVREEVEPSRQVLPFVAPVSFQEKLEETVDPVDRLHRVPLIREALCLGDVMDLVGCATEGDEPLAPRPIADQSGLWRYDLRVYIQGLFRRRLPGPTQNEDGLRTVRRGADAELVPG